MDHAPAEQRHIPVMLERCLDLLAPALDTEHPVVVDATLGMGGHTHAMLERFPGLRVVGIDRDPQALELAGERLAHFGERFTGIHTTYDHIDQAVLDVGQKLLEAGPFQRPARDAAVVILIADQHPALGALAGDVGLAGLSLGMQAVEFLLQPFLGGLARVDRAALAADGICALIHQSFPRFRSRNPKKR